MIYSTAMAYDDDDVRTDEIKYMFLKADKLSIVEELGSFILIMMLIRLRQAVSYNSSNSSVSSSISVFESK